MAYDDPISGLAGILLRFLQPFYPIALIYSITDLENGQLIRTPAGFIGQRIEREAQ
jgi:hypothetical protein